MRPVPSPEANPPNARVLIVDDDVSVTELFARMLRLEGFEVWAAHSADEGLVLALLQSVGVACSNILTSDRQGERYESRIWRRRLDAARKVLNGQLEIDEG